MIKSRPFLTISLPIESSRRAASIYVGLIEPFLTIFVSFESDERGLSNDTKLVKNGSVELEIWTILGFYNFIFFGAEFPFFPTDTYVLYVDNTRDEPETTPTNLVSFESGERGLSNDTKFVKNGSV